MEGIAGRLKFLRLHWNVSGRKLSTELGLSLGTWSAYELGTSLPGSSVLMALAERGADINWLLTGEGGPWRAHAVQPLPTNDPFNVDLLAILSERSNINLKRSILDALVRIGKPVGCATIAADIDTTEDKVRAACCELLENRVITCAIVNFTEVYGLDSLTARGRADGQADHAALCLEAMRFIGNDVKVGLHVHPDTTLLINGIAGVANGTDYLGAIRTTLAELGRTHHGAACKVKLVVAVRIEE